MYKALQPLLFRIEPERAHHLVVGGLAWCDRHPGALRLIQTACRVRDERLEVRRFGLTFPNPVGLAAGLDKNAVAVRSWGALGFGSVEVGSVTAEPQPGNPRPRLFRLPADEALINRMGFNNAGADAMVERLGALRATRPALSTPLGVNVGKSRSASLDEAVDDYRCTLTRLWPFADYLVINVSSPNTPGLRELQSEERLVGLLDLIVTLRDTLGPRPVLLKIAPDLTIEQLHRLVVLAEDHDLSGIVATNTTVAREGLSVVVDEPGGLSGRPLQMRSLTLLKQLNRFTRLPIVSVGGIFTAADVIDRLRAGASLVQVYTGLVYRGPMLLREINRGLLGELDRLGARSIEALIGTEL